MKSKQLLKWIALPMITLMLAIGAYAQERVVTGKVTDAKDGSGVPNASVQPKGASTGTTTATDGTFRVIVPAGTNMLVISSVGYQRLEVDINGKTSVDISLTATSANLNEVVVVGYGTSKKKDLTGSITAISSKDFVKGAITTPEQLISGKVAGVSITSNGGAPGAGSRIRIRGAASLNASNDPLIVIDGVPVSNDGISGSPNPLSLINPNDIESFNILKDASSAAIYGNRASNGVIIITTKKGKKGKPVFTFNSQIQVAKIARNVEVLSASEFRTFVNTYGTATQKSLLGSANTNWQDEIYQQAISTDNNLSVSGGFKGLPYRVSFGYLHQNGILKTDKMDRYSLALNLSPVLLNNHLKIDINLKGINSKFKFADQGAIGSAFSFDPTQPIKNGSKYGGFFEWLNGQNPNTLTSRNPVGLLENRDNTSDVLRSIGNIQFDYKFHFLPDLKANLNLGYDISRGDGTDFAPDFAAAFFSANTTGGQSNYYKQTQRNLLLDFYLNYTREFKKLNSRLEFLAGYSYQDFLTTNYNYQGRLASGLPNPNSAVPQFEFDKPQNTLLSYYGRLNYSYKGKYLLTATIRRDESSRFAKENRVGYFPSGSLAWRISQEGFLKNSDIVNDLKLRVGYGQTGQQNIGENYSYLPYIQTSTNNAQYQFGNTFINTLTFTKYDPNRKWERSETYNIGFDYSILKNRIFGTVDFYLRKTKDLLSVVDIPLLSNFGNTLLTNVGNMENKGIEINLNVIPIQGKEFTWEAGINATFNNTKITKLTNNTDPNFVGNIVGGVAGGTGTGLQINAVGQWPTTFYTFKQVYDANNNPIEGLYEDLNRDGIINEKDRYFYNQPEPTIFLGFSSNFTYKNWNLGFVMRSNIGNYVYNNVWSNNGVRDALISSSDFLNNGSRNVLTTNFRSKQLFSDYYVSNASFIKMDNINIGYNFGKVFRNKANLRFYGNVQNVFVITKYKGIDPEIATGIDNTLYPRPRTFVLGFNLDF